VEGGKKKKNGSNSSELNEIQILFLPLLMEGKLRGLRTHAQMSASTCGFVNWHP